MLTIAVLSLGVAAVLYSPQMRQSLSLLYTDAATRVLDSGAVNAAQIQSEQQKVWGSASLPPSTPAKSSGPSADDAAPPPATDGSHSGSSGAQPPPSGPPGSGTPTDPKQSANNKVGVDANPQGSSPSAGSEDFSTENTLVSADENSGAEPAVCELY